MREFQKLGVAEPLADGLAKESITVPTAIQEKVIPAALAGRDIIGRSATGTGKTLAYLLPLFQRLNTEAKETQAIILAPTHELAIQIQRRVELLAKNSGLPVTAAPVIGNVNIVRQMEKLKSKPHIITGSSGRILELIKKRKINAQTVKTIVLDEADRLLDDSNWESVQAVIKTTRKDRQTMLFSATITKAALERSREILRAPEIIDVTLAAAVPAEISHMRLITDRRDKIETLRKLAVHLAIDRALVFVNKSDDIAVTVAKLNYHGLKAVGLSGDAGKIDRKKAIEDFRSGRARFLVASDVAARGLDIPGVSFVINLDFPEEPLLYLHRAGRTGRAGQSGTAISLVTPRESALADKAAKILKTAIPQKELARGRLFEARPRRMPPRQAKTPQP
ncbi:MAG: DEAD/DEAH box helicase [Negativicutes bacterium]|nr:DEAD/DEAH box helicase [Negativicutes bacterium]